MTPSPNRARALASFPGLALLACASTPAPSAPMASSAPAPAVSTSNDEASGTCTAEMTTESFARASHGEPPEGWTAAGKLVVEMKDGRPTRMELRDPSGKAIESSDVTGSNEEMRETLKREACKVGGVLLVAPKEPGKADPRIALLIIRPVAPDENADLRLLCAGPPDPLDKNNDFDADQTRVIAAQAFGEKLTSPKWRGWLYEMRKELHGAADMGSVWRAKAAELRAARKDCWFASVLEAR